MEKLISLKKLDMDKGFFFGEMYAFKKDPKHYKFLPDHPENEILVETDRNGTFAFWDENTQVRPA